MLGDVFPWVGERLERADAAAIFVLDASTLLKVEGFYGADAFFDCFDRLAALLRDALGDRLGSEDLIVRGEAGRAEVLAFLFRSRDSVGFYDRELLEVGATLGENPRFWVAPSLFSYHLRGRARMRSPHPSPSCFTGTPSFTEVRLCVIQGIFAVTRSSRRNV